MPLKVEFKDHRRTVASAIGSGSLATGQVIGDQLSRDISSRVEVTTSESA